MREEMRKIQIQIKQENLVGKMQTSLEGFKTEN